MTSEPLEAARHAVAASEQVRGTMTETRLLRDALRALVQWAEERESRDLAPLFRSHESYLAEGCRCHKGFCAVHDD